MKKLTVLIFAIVAGVSGYLIKVPIAPLLEPTLAPSGWIHIQKLMLPLFENVCEESRDPIVCKLSEEFMTSISASDFWDSEVITKFQNLKSGKGFLPKGQIFSEYNVEHTNELRIIFDVMRNAKTFDTFYQVASWARQNLNCGLYVSLIYLAMENRRDTEKLTLPPPYELLPNYFIRKDIIIQGSSLLAGEDFTPSAGVRDEGNKFTLDANYTANFYDNDDETKLAYFREDIGLNSHYFLRMLKCAPWLNADVDINSRYGEEMYHMMKQLVARYNLERYSNGMPEQDNIDWDSLSDAPYDPMLVYSNGNEFIHRTSPVQLPENADKALLKTIENNIATVVSHMRENGYNKTQILNHLMEILVTGKKSYDMMARRLLGNSLSNNEQPTVFDHYMTSLRDPMIWRLYKTMVDMIDNSLKALPPYTKSELYFPGVELISIDVKKIMTNFDYFEFDITEALKIGNGDTTFQVKIGQPRLNHKPFMIKLNISSLVTQKGMVKIYLGPKMMPGEFAKKKNLFYALDCFEINIKRGSNVVTRTSIDMKTFATDFTSLITLKKRVEDAQFGIDSLPMNTVDFQIRFPERLSLPKGTSEGLPLQLFVFIAPLMKTTIGGPYSTATTEFNSAVLSPLYPLDLVMEDRILLDLPNALVKDLLITHKGVSKVSNYDNSGATVSWFDDNTANGLHPRPTFSGNEPFVQDNASFRANGQFSEYTDVNPYYNDQPLQNLKTTAYGSKPNRPQFQKPDYTAQRTDYKTLYKNKSTEKPIESLNDSSATNNIIMDETQNMVTPFNANDNIFDIENEKIQNDDSYIRVKHNSLTSSDLDSTVTKKNSDYKLLPKSVKPDYKNMYKTARKSTENPFNVNNNVIYNKYNDKDNQNIAHNKPLVDYTMDLSKPMATRKYEDIVVKDVGNVDIYKVIKDYEQDNIFNENRSELENSDYFGIYKDGENEQFVKVVPVDKTPISNTQKDKIIYKNIHQANDYNVIDNSDDTTDSNTFDSVTKPSVPNKNSIFKYIINNALYTDALEN